MGRKLLDLSPQKLRERQKELLLSRKAASPARFEAYSRADVLRRCTQRTSMPTAATVRKYKFTRAELEPILARLTASE